MMRRLVTLLCLAAVPLQAQQVTVMSGRHPDFDRLTFALAATVDWTVGRTATGYGVRLARPADLDVSQIYNRIGRNRIAEVTPRADGIDLVLGCDCHVTAFRFLDTYLVIDIEEGQAEPGSIFEEPLSGSEENAIAEAPAPSVPDGPNMVLPLAPGTPPVPVGTGGLRTSALLPDRVTHSELGGLERKVADSLARAASQGLVTLAAPKQERQNPVQHPKDHANVPNRNPAPDSVDHDNRSDAPFRHIVTHAMPGLTTSTSLDALQTRLDTTIGGVCWSPAFTALDLPEDAPADFGARIAPLRAAVTDDRDRADAAAVVALALGYLSFGFGTEAIQSLAIDGVMNRRRLALRAMAEIVDDLPQTRPDLARQLGCPGSTGLWALLADGTPEAVGKFDPDQIVQQFKLLPQPVQTVLGPRLADQLRRGDRGDLAELVLAPALRLEAPPVDAILVDSSLAIDRGDVAGATDTLTGLAQNDPRMTPQALVRLVDLQLAQKETIAPETMDLLETMQFEFRSQPVAADLLRVRVAGMAQAGNFIAALRLLPQAEALLTAEDALTLRSTVTAAVTSNADDMLFLDIAFRPMGRDVEPGVQNAVARRLIGLGFPERATEVVNGPAIGSVMAERRYLRAQSAMDMGQPDIASAILNGMTTPRALSILGTPRAASDQKTADDTATAWRNGDWARLATSGDGLLQEAAALVQDGGTAIPDPDAPLASGRALIEDAARTRATIDALMSRFAPPS